MDLDELLKGAYEMAQRKRDGFTSCCAFIDLLGMTDLILNNIEDAQFRIDALHEGLVDSLDIYPGLTNCRASFFGDSIVIVREISPDEHLENIYPDFCGHVFCINSLISKIENDFGGAGLRGFISHGKLIPLTKPGAWNEPHLSGITQNWKVLTGVNEAFAKCCKADFIGSRGGFSHKMFWVEELETPNVYSGIPYLDFPPQTYMNESIYKEVYQQIIVEKAQKKVSLDFKNWQQS